MSKWIGASLQERTVMLQQVAESKGIVDSADYADMLRTYIYDKKSALTYEQLTARLEELLQRFRNSKN